MHIVHAGGILQQTHQFLFIVLSSIQLIGGQGYTDLTEGDLRSKLTLFSCKEIIGPHVCLEMRQRRPYEFKIRCRTDVDFAMLQCCRTCRTNIAQLGRELFAHGPSSRHCFDRHNRRYCNNFVRKSGIWAKFGNNLHSGCNGENAALAFRVCRRSCGFCRVSLYRDEEETESRCKTRPTTTTPGPPSILPGHVPDRAYYTYLEKIIDEINDDYTNSSPKHRQQPVLTQNVLFQI